MTLDGLLSRPDAQSILARANLVSRNDGNGARLFDADTLNRVNDTSFLQEALGDFSALDPQGRLAYGSGGPLKFAGNRFLPGDYQLNGQTYVQSGQTYDQLNQGWGKYLNQAGVTPGDFSYDQTYGNVMADNPRTTAYRKLVGQDIARQNEGGLDAFFSNMPITLGAGGASALAAPALASSLGISNGLAKGLISSGLSLARGGNPLMGLVTAGASSLLPSFGELGDKLKGLFGPETSSKVAGFFEAIPDTDTLIDADPLDLSDAGTGAQLESVNPLADLQGGSMDDFDLSSLFPDPTSDQLTSLWAQELGALNSDGSINWSAIDQQIADPTSSIFMGSTEGAAGQDFGSILSGAGSGLGGIGQTIAKLLLGNKGAAALTSGGLSGLFGSDPFGSSGLLGLGARLAPGYAALQFAQNQGGIDSTPFDTSNLSSLYDKAGALTDPATSSALQGFDLRTGQARGELLDSLSKRGVMGSSFGNYDLANFDTSTQAQRGKLVGDLGLQGITTQRGIAGDILGAQQVLRQQQLQQQAVRNALFGRSFDILGRAVSPAPSLFGGLSST